MRKITLTLENNCKFDGNCVLKISLLRGIFFPHCATVMLNKVWRLLVMRLCNGSGEKILVFITFLNHFYFAKLANCNGNKIFVSGSFPTKLQKTKNN